MTAEPQDQGFPAFYSEAPTIKLRDPLAQFLGAARHGVIEYRYTDVVCLSGGAMWKFSCAMRRAVA